jgi:PD-(D/E)XK nuclease superfamily
LASPRDDLEVPVTSRCAVGEPQGDDPARGLVNPRLSDVFGLVIRQEEVDFVVPHLCEDLPLCIDPFLLWKSDRLDYRELHQMLLGFVDQVRTHALAGRVAAAHTLLAEVREPVELGLGYAAGTKRGSAIGPSLSAAIIETFKLVPQLEAAEVDHLEVLALLVPKIAEDRISDITASVLKRWLAEFTSRRCRDLGIPTRRYRVTGWDFDRLDWRSFDAQLPYNPTDESPVLLVPLDLLRRLPWINYPDYYKTTYARLVLAPDRRRRVVPKEAVLAYNRANYEIVRGYVTRREEQSEACVPDPLFTPLRLDTLKRKAAQLRALPSGRADGADKKFEHLAFDLLSSLLYPELDLAKAQVRTISGAHIRDIIFHNDGKTPFLQDLRDLYHARQVVFELKNVAALDPEHVNQLYRYLDGENMGRYGLLLARTPPPRNVQRNVIDLHSSKRAAVICLDDSDIELMVQLLDSGRRPIEALRKKHVEFTRQLPQ